MSDRVDRPWTELQSHQLSMTRSGRKQRGEMVSSIRVSSPATRMKHVLRILFPTIAILLILFEWSFSVRANGGLAAAFSPGNPAALFYKLFRLAGLAAFTLVAFQVLTGPYMKFWETLYGTRFYRFHAYEGLLALLIAFLHPSLLFISLSTSTSDHLPYFLCSRPCRPPGSPCSWTDHDSRGAGTRFTSRTTRHSSSPSCTASQSVLISPLPRRPIWVLFFIAMVMGFVYRRCRSRGWRGGRLLTNSPPAPGS